MPIAKKKEVWHRLDNEGDKAYAAFQVYRDMGANRTIAKAAEEVGKSRQMLNHWSSTHHWGARTRAWDAHLDGVSIKEQEHERKAMGQRHARMAMMMQQKIVDALVTVDYPSLAPHELARWAEVAFKIERISRGEPDSYSASVAGERPDLTGLSDDRLTELMTILEEAQKNDGVVDAEAVEEMQDALPAPNGQGTAPDAG